MNEGHQRTMIVQVARISKPLLSVSRLNDTGNAVDLHPDQPTVENLKTGERTALRRVGKTFILDDWVEIPDEKERSRFTRP